MPVGSCLSQWAANLYSDGLDHFVKRELKIRGYLRYMDDFTLFTNDREVLVAAREAIEAWLQSKRRLELKPNYGHVVPAAEPATYLGYRMSRAGLSPSRKLRRRLRARMRRAAERGPEAVVRTVRSYVRCFAANQVGPVARRITARARRAGSPDNRPSRTRLHRA
jgi:hypothetical protein